MLLPRLRRWGATREEASRPLPGDDLIPDPLYATTRAITVQAPAEAVFPWLVQLGQNRGGFYTYDVLENLLRLDIHSADRIHPEWQDLEAGSDYVSLDPEQTMKLTVVVLDRPRAFVIRTGGPDEPPQAAGDFFKGEIAATWAFVVEPLTESTSRLLIRWRARWRETVPVRLRARLHARARPLHHGRGHAARHPRPRRARAACSGLDAPAPGFAPDLVVLGTSPARARLCGGARDGARVVHSMLLRVRAGAVPVEKRTEAE